MLTAGSLWREHVGGHMASGPRIVLNVARIVTVRTSTMVQIPVGVSMCHLATLLALSW